MQSVFGTIALVACVLAFSWIAALLLRRRHLRAAANADACTIEATLETLDLAIWHTDASGHCLRANRAWRQFAGRWQGLDWLEAFTLEDPAELRSRWIGCVSRQEIIADQWWSRDTHGERHCYAVSGKPQLGTEGQVTGYRCLMHDITALKAREEALQSGIVQVNEAAARHRSQLGDIAEELRLPLAGLSGEDHSDGPRAGAEAVPAMLAIIDDLQAIAPSAAERHPAPENLAELLQQCISLAAPLAQTRGIPLALWVDDAVPEALEIDRLAIRQIVGTLLGNAIRHTAAPGVVNCEARIESASDGRYLLISVIDTGCGLSPERLAQILGPAPMLPANGRLARVRRQIDALEGSLVVHSRPSVGSNFALRLPLRRELATGEDGIFREGDDNDASDLPLLHGARLLIVEDDASAAHLAQTLCARLGLAAALAESGEAAIAMAERQRHFDAVLMDLGLPGMDGFEAACRLRHLLGHDLPVIALVKRGGADEIAACRTAGMTALLVKPLTSLALARELARCMVAEEGARLGDEITLSEASRTGLRQSYHDRKVELMAEMRQSLDIDAKRTDWLQMAEKLSLLAGIAGQFGERELGHASRQLERRLKLSGEPSSCQEALRRAWSQLQHAA